MIFKPDKSWRCECFVLVSALAFRVWSCVEVKGLPVSRPCTYSRVCFQVGTKSETLGTQQSDPQRTSDADVKYLTSVSYDDVTLSVDEPKNSAPFAQLRGKSDLWLDLWSFIFVCQCSFSVCVCARACPCVCTVMNGILQSQRVIILFNVFSIEYWIFFFFSSYFPNETLSWKKWGKNPDLKSL